MSQYAMRAIPTIFDGIRYRSRLEAKWASFFSYMCWKTIYEPMDLRGWAPDFLITPKSKPMFVEVKPITQWTLETVEKTEEAVNQSYMHGSGKNPILMVGVGPEIIGEYAMLGWLGIYKNKHWFWDDAVYYKGDVVGLSNLNDLKPPEGEAQKVKTAWSQATNSTQWIPA